MLPRRLLCSAVALVLAVAAAAADPPATGADIARLARAGEATDRDFARAQAAGLTLARVNLAATNLRGADLRGASLTAVSLQKADLRQANLRGAVFERVDLLNADLSGADLSGAVLCLVNLENANLTGALLDGATFEGAGFSLSGAPYLAALHLALQNATNEQLSRAWVAGLSGDAFAFSYGPDPQAATRTPGFWPGLPFNANPLLAAATNLGLTATLTKDAASERVLLDKLQEKTIYLLPVKLPGVNERVTQGKPLWAVITSRDVRDEGTFYVLQAPPFGSHELRQGELFGEIWGGPWDTTDPVGTMLPARRQLVAIRCGVAQPTSDQVLAALRQAVTIIAEKRTYGPLTPGAAGLTRLAGELRAASKGLDSEDAKRLVTWQRFPRHCLIGSLNLACDFLGEAALVLPADTQQSCTEAKLVLRSALTGLDTKWPALSAAGDALTPEQSAAFAQAADLIAEVAAAEHKAAALFAAIAP